MHDRFRFLAPWTLVLPEAFPSVVAVAGSGGRTTLLLRLWHHYREQSRTVLWTQTSAHAAPFDLLPLRRPARAPEVAAALERHGGAWVGGGEEQRPEGGLTPDRIEELRREVRPEVLLVDAHAACGAPMRQDGVEPVWPHHAQLAFVVGSLGAVGRPWGPHAVAGVDEIEVGAEGAPRRVSVEDVLAGVREVLRGPMPARALALPFLTSLAAFRDLDGMFEIVSRLWEEPGVRCVCLAELVGDERRDAADRAGLADPGAVGPWEGERVYAVYPAALDGPPGKDPAP